MSRTTGKKFEAVYSDEKGARSVLRLRMVELVAFFVIVFVAREIANFDYQLELFFLLFFSALVLQLTAGPLWGLAGRWRNWSRRQINVGLLWYSSYLDFLVVVAIIYLTGTIESPFLFLLVVPLFFASHLFPWRCTIGVFLTGAITAVAVIGYLEMREAIPHFNCYFFKDDVYQNTHYYVGSLLVLSGFLSLILFLSNAFQDHFQDSLRSLRKQGEETHVKIHELSRLYDISLGINAVMTVETLLKMVAKEATLLLGQPWASIVLINRHQEITHSVSVGAASNIQSHLGLRIRKGGLSEWLWKHNTPVIIDDVTEDKRASKGEFLIATKVRSLIGLPLSDGQNVIGVVYVGDFVQRKLEDNQLRLLRLMCDQLAIAIAKSKLYESIQRKMQTYEKQLEHLDRTNHLKSEYVSHVSHELRTPLTSIKAYLETLEHHIDDPNFKEKKTFLAIVSKETERLIRIVNDILDVSSIEFGQKPLQRTTFPIQEVIHEVTSMLQPKLNDKNMRLEIIVPESLPKVDADKDLLTQVFINLISNAVKYSPEEKTIRIQAHEQPVDICISIEDQGIGIPRAQLERIFERYFRVKSEQSRHYDGVGLGLAIVKNIIEQHNGTITVSSEENVGSKFTFTIPKEHCVNELLGYISEAVSAKPELQQMMTLIVRMIAELLSAKIVSLMVLDQTRSELFIKVSYGLEEWIVEQARVKVGEGIAGKVAETGMPLLIDNIEKNEVYVSPNNPQYETMSLLSVPLKVNDVVVGVVNVNNKLSGQPFDKDDMNLLMSFAERISKSLERLRFIEEFHGSLQDTADAFRKMLETQVQTKSIEKIVDLAVKTSRKLGLSEKEVKVIQYVASVHDIGMTDVSDAILNKTFELTQAEIDQIKTHPRRGTELMRPLEFVELVSNIILYHHERVDGLGYPMGLKGDHIPIGSRILAVIDAYQSMTTDKPYRAKVTTEVAVRELVACAGKQFDPEVVECFVEVLCDDARLSTDQANGFLKTLDEEVESGSFNP